jgi:hypothetical protein
MALVFCLDVEAEPPTLKATADWLHDFVEAEAVVFSPGGIWVDRYHVSLTGCHVVVVQDITDMSCTKPNSKCSSHYSVTNILKREFDLKDIDPDRIEIEPFDNRVNLTTRNERPLVNKFVKYHEEFVKGFPEHDAYIEFGRHNSESAQRVAKALRHAVTLCGGVSSPF